MPPDEAHHALRVVRVREGERVAVFDGQGHEWTGPLLREGKRDLAVQVEAEQHVPRVQPALTLAQAWLHRDKAIEFIVRHGTELGVDHFVFFPSARSVAAPKPDDKWTKIAIEACKQCGRLWLPEFQVARDWTEALAQCPAQRWIAAVDLPGEPLSTLVRTEDAAVLIGPEGDFTEAEVAQARESGARNLSLGDIVLRSEMAAITAATLFRYENGALGPRHA